MTDPDDQTSEPVDSTLPDLTDISLADLRTAEGTALAHALERIEDDLADPDSAIAGFSSSL